MKDEWHTETVGDLQREGILLVEDGNHGEYRPRPDEFVEKGVAFIRAADMDAGKVLFKSVARINERARKRITKGIGAPGDVLLSHKGTVGKIALVPDDAPAFVCSPQTTFWRALDEERIDRKYLYAFLRSPAFRAQLATRSGETDMAPYVSLTSQRGLSVILPPIGTQRAIARILGSLDDKIEANRRMNETLEAMARAIFKSWFVDFDPVRAKAEGREPAGMDAETAALFPDSFEESEGQMVPNGWEQTSFAEAIEVNPQRFLGRGKESLYLEMSNMPTDSASAKNVTSRKFCSGTKFKNGDVLIARITPCLENGKVAFVDFLEIDQIGWSSTEYIVIRSHPPLSLECAYFLARFENFRSFLIANMNGTSGRQRVSTSCLFGYDLVITSAKIFSKFSEILRPIMAAMKRHDEECQSLAALINFLLPSLLSGKIRINEKYNKRPL